MNRRLDTRVDSIRADNRVLATPTSARAKQPKCARTDHKTTRAPLRVAKPKAASMDYQMGFTSGPSV
ncbi:hypothetical protein [Gymnodinialimonas sp.]